MSERKERTITIRLTESDCKTLMNKCGEHGITINELFENFAGDLAEGSYTNGSDERRAANDWFDRCWFGMFPERTLLNHLLNLGYDPEEYFELIAQLETAIKEKDYLNKHPDEQEPDDIVLLTRMISDCCKEINSMTDGWKPEGDPDLYEELRRVVSWIDEKNRFTGRSDSHIFEEELEEMDLEKVFSEIEGFEENDLEECYTLFAG